MRFALKLVLIAHGAGVMWVCPSFGTHGMGTLQPGLSHPDRRLFGGSGSSQAEVRSLKDADRAVENAILNDI